MAVALTSCTSIRYIYEAGKHYVPFLVDESYIIYLKDSAVFLAGLFEFWFCIYCELRIHQRSKNAHA